jgi:cholest-4-en-3-one 26-monooxygenase
MSAAPAEVASESAEIIQPLSYARCGYPHETWRRLRAESPVRYFEDTPVPFWAITKHVDVTEIGRSPEQFRNAPLLVVNPLYRKFQEELPFERPPTLIEQDNPLHRASRKLISSRFTPQALRKIHAEVDRIARKIVDDLFQQEEGEVDFVEKVSAPLPIAVIAWLLGVPKSDWNLLFDWTNRTIGAGDPEYQREGKTPQETAREAMAETYLYFSKLVEERKRKPEDDLITLFAQARVDGQPLPPMDVLAWCLIIVVAGNETTRNATTGGMLAFIENPGELRRLQQSPRLLPSAVEEVVRWTTPIIHFARTASEDYELRGKRIRAGDALALFYPSANRDEEVFDEPYRFRIDRDPNRHLGFGMGEHVCLGAHLARLELSVAYRHLLPRIEEVELAGPVQRLHSSLVGGVKHLPIRYKLRPPA